MVGLEFLFIYSTVLWYKNIENSGLGDTYKCEWRNMQLRQETSRLVILTNSCRKFAQKFECSK